MRLSTFAVSGYKNIRRRITLEGLAEVNVIHGENNVGKSNLLQAVDLFFGLVGTTAQRASTPLAKSFLGEDDKNTAWLMEGNVVQGVGFHVSKGSLNAMGYAADDIFHLEEPLPILLEGTVEIRPEDWRLAGESANQGEKVQFVFNITRSHVGCIDVALPLGRSVPTGAPFGPFNDHEVAWERLRKVADLIARGFSLRTGSRASSFALIDVFRRVAAIDELTEEDARRIVPLSLLLGLYDAKESVEPGVFQRWEIFERAMGSLGNLVGGGRFVVTYNRKSGRAYLAVQKGRMRLTIENMGTGVQQIASLLARALLCNSAIVAIEEPELSLRYDLQLRLGSILREVVDSGLGPQQMIMCSHSPAFETGNTFYAMTMTPEGPVIEQRPVREAPAFLQVELGVQVPAESGAFGYVSSDGLLRLPGDTCAELGVVGGGGVVVMKRKGHEYVEILSNERFLKLLHAKGQNE